MNCWVSIFGELIRVHVIREIRDPCSFILLVFLWGMRAFAEISMVCYNCKNPKTTNVT
jgi:hypothetical protein